MSTDFLWKADLSRRPRNSHLLVEISSALLATVDCNLQRCADLSHASIRKSTKSFDEDSDSNALNRVEVYC